MDKPQKPTELLPDSFGGIKENFSQDLQSTGYEPDVPDILGGANVNYFLDATGKNFKYNNEICDFINGLPINNVITVDSNNKLIYKNITDFSGANPDLSNLSANGEAHIDSVVARPLSSAAYTQADYPDEYDYWQAQAHSTFDIAKIYKVGSPKISEDGILSYPDKNNFIRTIEQFDFSAAKTWAITFAFKKVADLDEHFQLISINANDSAYLNTINISIQEAGKFTVGVWGTPSGSSTGIIFATDTQAALKNNVIYYARISYDAVSGYKIELAEDNPKNFETTYTNAAVTKSQSQGYMYIGRSNQTVTGVSPVEIYLPTLVVEIDGQTASLNKTAIDTIKAPDYTVVDEQLVYTPLSFDIPYTESTSGTKIVDAAYLDRVQDCYEQTGEALYLTIDEANQQYYLPMGTITGFTSKNRDKIDELNQNLTVDILQAMPTGASIAYEGTTAPDGWFAENGLEVQKSEYPKLYAVVGDKYNLETTQEGYFRLPNTNNEERFYEGSTTPGTLKDAGLPNITGAFNANQLYDGASYGSGAFQGGGATAYPTPNSGSDSSQNGFNFNASRSNSIYGKSTTVQPKSITKFFIIKHD